MNLHKKTTKLVLAALFIALCFLGGNLKILGSIAFDSLPAFIGTMFLGYGFGAAIGALAHLLSALLSGFPLSVPVHLITAVMMALTMVGFLLTIRLCQKAKMPKILSYILGCVVAVILNCPASLFVLIPLLGKDVVFGLLPALLPASVANAALAVIIYGLLPAKLKDGAACK